jgi:hypothetical protein
MNNSDNVKEVPGTRRGQKATKQRLIKAGLVGLLALAVIGVVVWITWSQIAVMVAPKKQAAISRGETAKKAGELFWQTFHHGEYENIQHVLELLTAADSSWPKAILTVCWTFTIRKRSFWISQVK